MRQNVCDTLEAKKDADKMMDMVTKLSQKVHRRLNSELWQRCGIKRELGHD